MSLQQGKTVREGVHDFLAKFPAVYAVSFKFNLHQLYKNKYKFYRLIG